MAIIVKDNKGTFSTAPEGLQQAVCCDVEDLGEQQTPWGLKHQVRLWWQSENRNAENGNKRFLLNKKYTASLNEKARLRGDLEAWRGKKFTDQEIEGFDLEKLIDANCQIQIQHNVSDKGGTFANVNAIVPVGKGMTKLQIEDYVRKQDRTTSNGGGKGEPNANADF